MRRTSLRALLLVGGLAAGCAAPEGGAGQGVLHGDPQLTLYEGDRSRLQTDLAPQEAELFTHRLDLLEDILDTTFPFLARPEDAPAPLTLVVADPARYVLHAREHGLDDGAGGAFVCRRGEVFLRYRPEDWLEEFRAGPPWPLEPRVRPLAAAVLRRRLIDRLGPDLEASWLEDGLVAVFVELAAHELGDSSVAVRAARERLLDAYLPLYLGAPPGLVAVLRSEPRDRKARVGAGALAWAAVRFLLTEPERTRLLEAALRRRTGAEVAEGVWQATLARAAEAERTFETYLRDAVVRELLNTIVDARTEVDRWEAAAAMRLIANIDIDADAEIDTRRKLVEATWGMLEERDLPVRFLDAYADHLDRIRAARSKLQAMDHVRRMVAQELERRSQGYGHPAVERGRREIGKALQRALEASAGG